MAARASLTSEYDNIITNPKQLFEWAKSLKTNMEFDFCSDMEYKHKHKQLAARFKQQERLKGTRGFHAVIPENGYLKCKKYSNSEVYETFKQ